MGRYGEDFMVGSYVRANVVMAAFYHLRPDLKEDEAEQWMCDHEDYILDHIDFAIYQFLREVDEEDAEKGKLRLVE